MAKRFTVTVQGVSAMVVDSLTSRVLVVFCNSEGYENVLVAAEEYAAKVNNSLQNQRR